MAGRKQTVPKSLVDGWVNMLKGCSKNGFYRERALAKLKAENEALYNAVIKRLGDK